jgi:DEAD/DEAH box helicase domain-containing protein
MARELMGQSRSRREHLCVGLTPELNEFRPLFGRDENGNAIRLDTDVFGYGPAISAKYYLAQCELCAAFLIESEPKEAICAGCNTTLPAEAFRGCIEPKAYRTDFNPKADIEEGVRGRTSRTANAILGPMVPAVEGTDNLLMCSRSDATIFRINRGRFDTFAPGVARVPGYSFSHNERKPYRKDLGTTSFNVFLPDQHWVADSLGRPAPGDEPSEQGVFLLSKKRTDSLILWPKTVSGELRLANVAGERRVTSVRAAAFSATFLLANQAAFELDIDPDELEIMEPGVRPVHGEYVPFLQIADRLVNGAGYCERLIRRDGSSKRALIDSLVEQILTGAKDTPAEDLFSAPHEKCSQACYLCIQRYSNQPYHGLLDWQLGLAFLEALWTTGFTAAAHAPGSAGVMGRWPLVAQKCAQVAAKIGGGEAELVGGLWTFSAPRSLGSSVRVVVIHPLWRADPDGFASPIMDTMSLLSDDGLLPMCADTFNLERRPSWVLETLRSSGEKSGWRY